MTSGAKWRAELGYLIRYAWAGILNAIVGLGTIFGLTAAGFSPVIANVAAFALGLLVAFFTSRGFVFRSAGKFSGDAVRYLAAFLFAFTCNLGVLHLALHVWGARPLVAQCLALTTYIVVIFLSGRFFVFSRRRRADPPGDGSRTTSPADTRTE